MKKLFALLLISVFALSGCALFETQPEKERIVYKFVPVPVEFTDAIGVPLPMDPVWYSTLSFDKKEETLFKLNDDSYSAIGTCNRRLKGIETWSFKQSLVYQPK